MLPRIIVKTKDCKSKETHFLDRAKLTVNKYTNTNWNRYKNGLRELKLPKIFAINTEIINSQNIEKNT